MTSVFVGQSMWGFHRSQEPQIHLLSTQLESASNEMDGDHQRLWSVYQLNSRQSYCHGRCLSRQSFCNNLMIQEIQPALSEEFRKLNLELVSQVFLAIWWSRRLLKIRLSRTITRWLNQISKRNCRNPNISLSILTIKYLSSSKIGSFFRMIKSSETFSQRSSWQSSFNPSWQHKEVSRYEVLPLVDENDIARYFYKCDVVAVSRHNTNKPTAALS